MIVLFALASLAALREFITLTPTRRGDHMALAVAFFVVLPLQYYLVWIDWYGLYSVFIPVYVFLLLADHRRLAPGHERLHEPRGRDAMGPDDFRVLPLPRAGAARPEDSGYEGRNLSLIAFLVLVVQSSDVLQYVWGKLIGRHKIAPELSPSKTVEGFLGGVASATVLGALLWWFTPFSPWQAGAMALMINLMGFFGGLVMSAIKRDRGVKDWGWMIEGHGGVLDRLDSVIFAAPVFFHTIRYFWTV